MLPAVDKRPTLHHFYQGWKLGMPDSKSDIIGRVDRLPIGVIEKGVLLPLVESIGKIVHSITMLYGLDPGRKEQIIVSG